MSASAAPQESWAVGLEAELELVAQARRDARRARRNADGSRTYPTMFRVPWFIKKLKPEAYEHELLSFGLFDRDFERTTRMDELRLQVVSEYLEQMKAMSNSSVHSWEDLCLLVAGPAESAQQLRYLYHDGPGESAISSTSVRSVLTLDAVFLTVYLIVHSEDEDDVEVKLPKFGRFFKFSEQKEIDLHFAAMYLDLWLLENQIPLSLVRNVWNQLYEDASDHRFDTLIKKCMASAVEAYLNPGAEFKNDPIVFTGCDHLLHCLYIAFCHENAPASELDSSSASGTTSPESPVHMSRAIDQESRLSSSRVTSRGRLGTLRMLHRRRWVRKIIRFFRRKRQNPTDDSSDEMHRSLLPVTELHKAGIVVRGEQGSVSEIRLVKSTCFKATLYLPQIEISDSTEKILRNLASFEMFYRSFEEHKLISYLRVMDDLINTEEDVRLLRKGKDPVIRLNYMGDDKDVAELFNALGKNVWFTQSEECRKLAKDVNDWCMQKKRQIFIRFVERFLDRPWIFISLVAATLLLVMTALQTTYTIKG